MIFKLKEKHLRGSGRTTRIIDAAIQEALKEKQAVCLTGWNMWFATDYMKKLAMKLLYDKGIPFENDKWLDRIILDNGSIIWFRSHSTIRKSDFNRGKKLIVFEDHHYPIDDWARDHGLKGSAK